LTSRFPFGQSFKVVRCIYYDWEKFYVSKEGGRWDFRFCGFGQFLVRFSVFVLKNRSFSVSISVFANNDGSFFYFYFLPNAIYGFAKEVTPRGVSNGPSQVKSARKIWALLELLAKIS